MPGPIQDWIRLSMPGWSEIQVAPAAKYLGMFLGTVCKDLIWKAPTSKWRSRVSSIMASRAPPSIATSLYNIRALPTLSYVAQLSFPPRELLLQEGYSIARLLHVPPNSFSRADFFSIANWGSVKIRGIFASLVAALVRASLSTLKGLQANFSSLRRIALEELPLAGALSGVVCVDFWDTPPIAQTLSCAAAGFPAHPLLGKFLPDIVAVARQAYGVEPGNQRLTSGIAKPFKLQQFLYEEIMKALYPDSVALLLRRRWPVLCPDVPFSILDLDLASVKTFLTKLSPAWATSIMKTWSNAWTTSHRMHEHVLRNCVFGCQDEADTLSH